jgi:hypothetical protein
MRRENRRNQQHEQRLPTGTCRVMRGSDHSIVSGRFSLRIADSAVNSLEGRPRLYWAYRLECIGSKAGFLLSKFKNRDFLDRVYRMMGLARAGCTCDSNGTQS